MKNHIILILGIMLYGVSFGQETNLITQKDTTQLDEIIVIGTQNLSNYREEKTLSSIDDYLEKSNRITMIKRGNYAWEPTLNNMTSERLNVTIDGMQIFGACTDKMDPITSYVDVSNLKQVAVNSGQEGSENGHNIGGAIDLQLPESKFNNSGLKSSVDLGYETNGNYKTVGAELEYSNEKFYLNTDGIYRKSDNFDAGNNTEIPFSQFEKYNISALGGYKFSDNHSLDASIIYDKATDIGYPALPMDVSLAEAFITSLSHNYQSNLSYIKLWETKLYFNTITHIMDDSKRPIVPIRMDMPGWSDTYGFYSKLRFEENKHEWHVNLNGFYNRSLAEMTMYPNDSNQPSMFMYTWPDIRTLYSGLFVKDLYSLSDSESINTSVRLGFHNNTIAKDEGLQSLKIFYPNLTNSKNRFLTSVASNYHLHKKDYHLSFGLGYGERAPSVTEGYGFFIFNNFENFDYIGNPNLKNEKSLEANIKTNYHSGNFKIGLESSYFHIKNYVVGDIDSSLSPMTIGANGVKLYTALDYASIFDVYLNSSYQFNKQFSMNTSIGYNYGKGSNGEYLPLIKPFSYIAELNYTTTHFNAALQLKGNGNQSNYSSFYGETETAAYGILNLNLGNMYYLKSNKLVLKYGVENIMDAYYSTYADWNNIARQGRNFYINASFVFN